MKKSPFTHRKIIRTPEDFIGRRDTLLWMLSRLDNTVDEVDCISITGERKIGKSSLVYALTYKEIQEKYLSAPEEFSFIYFDLQKKALFPSPECFFAEVMKQVQQHLKEPVETRLSRIDYREFDRFLQELDLKNKKIVFLFDEFETLCVPPFDADFFNYLRSVVAQFKIGYITTSREPLDSLCASRKIQSSPFFNYFTTYNLELFNPNETLSLFKMGEDRTGVKFTGSEQKAIIAIAGHHPFFLQIACNLVFIQKQQGVKFSKKKLQEDFLREAESHFKYYIEKSSKHEKKAIYQIAHGKYSELLSYEKGLLARRSLVAFSNRRPVLFSESFKEFALNYLSGEMSAMDLADTETDVSMKKDKCRRTTRSMKEIVSDMKKVSKTNNTILLSGETGTGKGYYARKIFEWGEYNKNFVVCDCTTIPDNIVESELFGYIKGAFTGAAKNKIGLVETASDGTLFIDEIGDANLNVQAKLLRLIDEKTYRMLGDAEDRSVDIRIIAATNQNLDVMVRENKFRKDLLARLQVCSFHIPPLRERREEIPALCRKFLKALFGPNYRNKKRISKEVCKKLMEYDWPKNVRELKNSIKKAAGTAKGRELKYDDIVGTVK